MIYYIIPAAIVAVIIALVVTVHLMIKSAIADLELKLIKEQNELAMIQATSKVFYSPRGDMFYLLENQEEH